MARERGFFERSFMFRMIRDFFSPRYCCRFRVGHRYAAILYELKTMNRLGVQQVADKLSNDIRSIMLNAGGPTAARTIYPIIDKNYQLVFCAVEPSQITVDSINFQVWMLWFSRFGHWTPYRVQS